MKKFVLVLFALSIVISSAVGQKKSIAIRSSEKVRQEQRDTRKRINKTKGEISENTAKTRKGLKQLGEIEADIAVRQEAINRAGARIAELTQLESNISQLKTDYAQSLRAMRRQRQTLNSISYLFSAESFAQAFRRVRYIQELGRWRHDKTLKLGYAVA